MLQTSVHSDSDSISTYFLSSKSGKVYDTSSNESNWVGCPVEENIKVESHKSFGVSGENLTFSLQTSELLGNY